MNQVGMPAVMLIAEQMNMQGAWLTGMRPRSWMARTVSGRSPGEPMSSCVKPHRKPITVAATTV